MLRELQGYVPGHGQVVCLLEADPDARFLLMHLAPGCTVTMLREDVFGLSHLLANTAQAQIPVRHRGILRQLLIKPYEGALPLRFHDKPVELQLMRAIRVVFRAEELRDEARSLVAALERRLA